MPSGDFVFLGAYESEGDALTDYNVVKELHRAGALGAYHAAVVARDGRGNVLLAEDARPTRHGPWAALMRYSRRGTFHAEIGELGRLLGAGGIGLVVTSDSTVSRVLEQELKHALITIAKGIAADPVAGGG